MKTVFSTGLILLILVLSPLCSNAQNHAQNGWNSYNQGDYAKALEHFTNHLNSSPKDAVVLHGRALVYSLYTEYANALSDINNSIKYYPKKDKENISKAYLARADIYANIEELEKALGDYNEAIKIDPKSIGAISKRANFYFYTREYSKSDQDYNFILRMDESQFFAYGGLGQNLLAQEKYEEAINMLSKGIRLSPNYSFALSLRAWAYKQLGKYALAINDYDKVVLLSDNSDINAFYYLGECYREIGNYDQAIFNYEKAINLGSNIPDLYAHWGDVNRLKGDFDSAIEGFSKAIEMAPNDYYPYYKRGWTYEFAGDLEKALVDYNKAIEIAPEYSYVYLNRGRLLGEMNLLDNAKRDFEFVVSKENDIYPEGNCKHYALWHLGHKNEAIEWITKILEQYPTAGNFYDAACLYSLMNEKNSALKYLESSFQNGYVDFHHIQVDGDMDNIRESLEFKELVKKIWKY